MKSKKYHIFALVIIFFLSSWMTILPARGAALSAGDTPLIRISDADAEPGEKFRVNISLENNPGFISMILHVVYNQAVMTLTGVRDMGRLDGTEQNPNLSLFPYVLSWGADTRTENYTGNDILAVLEFELNPDVPAGDYDISVWYNASADEILNLDLKSVNFEIQNGAIHTDGPKTPEADTPAITGVTRLSDRIEVSVEGIPASGGQILCAVYDRRGCLSGLASRALSAGNAVYDFQPDGAKDGFVKIFLINSRGVPLCESRRG